MARPLKALILGDGNMAKVHRQAYAECGVEIIPNETTDPIEPDIVSICTPDYLHGQQVIDALNAGCHVMCEKPFCTKTEELDQIEALAGELKVCVNYPLRRHPPFTILDRNPKSFNLSYFYGRKHKTDTGWRAHRDYSPVMGGMIHMIDLVCHVTGQQMEIAGVSASKGYVNAAVYLQDGTSGSISCDFSEYEGHHHKVEWGGNLTIINRMPTDKEVEIRNFVNGLATNSWSNDTYFHPTRTALEIDWLARQVR